LNGFGFALPSVSSKVFSTNSSDFSFSSMRFANRRLKSNSPTLSALLAPGAMSDFQDDLELRSIALRDSELRLGLEGFPQPRRTAQINPHQR
jgi:hypothetical protein